MSTAKHKTFCQCITGPGGVTQWDKLDFTVHVINHPPGWALNSIDRFVWLELQRVQKHTSLMFELRNNVADINLSFVPMDGHSGTLGRAWYPSFSTTDNGRIQMDIAEDWTEDRLRLVFLHELLHALGLRHSEDDRDVMYPYMITDRPFLSPNDIRRLQAIFGDPPRPLPTPPRPCGFWCRLLRLFRWR